MIFFSKGHPRRWEVSLNSPFAKIRGISKEIRKPSSLEKFSIATRHVAEPHFRSFYSYGCACTTGRYFARGFSRSCSTCCACCSTRTTASTTCPGGGRPIGQLNVVSLLVYGYLISLSFGSPLSVLFFVRRRRVSALFKTLAGTSSAIWQTPCVGFIAKTFAWGIERNWVDAVCRL